jgi:hypothetical protein
MSPINAGWGLPPRSLASGCLIGPLWEKHSADVRRQGAGMEERPLRAYQRATDAMIAEAYLPGLTGRRHADRGLGVDEELSAEGRLGRAADARRRAEPRSGFSWPERANETHPSTTDPEARLCRKGSGKEAKLCFMGHALMGNRIGLVVDACLTEASGHALRIAALHMIELPADRPRPITLGADKAYDAEDFVNELHSTNATPHVAQNTNGRSSARQPHVARRGLRSEPARNTVLIQPKAFSIRL